MNIISFEANLWNITINKTGNVVLRNNKVRLFNHCGNGKAISITCYERVFIALHIQHAMRMVHIVNCGLSGSPVLVSIVLQTALFYKKAI
jgi:hypothetical protein